MKFILLAALALASVQVVLAECAHDLKVKGKDLAAITGNVFIADNQGRYSQFNLVTKVDPEKTYNVQVTHSKILPAQFEALNQGGKFDRYNQKYIEYYRYSHIQKFLVKHRAKLNQLGYHVVTIGKSVRGRDLYAVYPNKIIKSKTTVVMFGRHHGDEGTANWIIEGFMNELLYKNLDWFAKHQLILYPMVNPDGAEAQTRHNANGYDLNRSWSFNPSGDVDEIKTYHNHLRGLLKQTGKVSIVLDMHGSFTRDFIYRVDQNFKGRAFYNHQQQFIDELKIYDPFQNGNFDLSNGHPKMARIVMVKNYGYHALTHETPRDIELRNRRGRSKQSLMAQGVAVMTSIRNLYENK